MNFVTIKESHYQGDLVVLKSRLESEGIECRFKNELTTQVLNHIPSFLVELQVPEDQAEKARIIMVEIGELNAETSALACKNCGSEDVEFKIDFFKRIQLFFRMIAGTLTFRSPNIDNLLKKGKYKCRDCGEEFK